MRSRAAKTSMVNEKRGSQAQQSLNWEKYDLSPGRNRSSLPELTELRTGLADGQI